MDRSKCLLNRQYSVNKNITFVLGLVLRNYSKIYIVVKETADCMRHLSEIIKSTKSFPLRINLYLIHAYQKSITHTETMQKISIFVYQCIIC